MPSSSTFLSNLLGDFLWVLPLWIVYIGGTVLVLLRWRNHPRASRLAFLGLMMLIFDALVMTIAARWFVTHETDRGWQVPQSRYIYEAIEFARAVILAAGIAFLLFAVYSSRLPAAARRAERVRALDFPFDRPRQPLPEAVPVDEPDVSIRERKE